MNSTSVDACERRSSCDVAASKGNGRDGEPEATNR